MTYVTILVMDIQHGSSEHTLTDRQMEVLNWASQGKTNIEISMILGISECGVRKHYAAIAYRIDCPSNSCRAILCQAWRMGVITSRQETAA